MGPYDLLERVVRAFDALGVPYLVTGAMASVTWGEPRMTIDIDIVADMKTEHISGLGEHFPKSEFYFDEAMIREAIEGKGQFNIVHPESGLKIDIYVTNGLIIVYTGCPKTPPALRFFASLQNDNFGQP
ncbi:MAG: hypothetical protein HY671_03520, partial [Chloroflexi bacterium]|nr:hypothetical protein [Chloroflexota bacterium]